MAASSRLFQPLRVGTMELKHRVAMAPLTRFRATKEHIPTDLMVEYYTQRASVPGTLLITEGTFVSPQHGGYDNVPGIYNDAQVAAWKKITDAVHAKGSFIVVQLWALGRAANAEVLGRDGFTVKSSSAAQLDDHVVPAEMTLDDIRDAKEAFAAAARNAARAGFDAVEIHGANGYLLDQFTQDVVNQRTDAYGGSVENRSRFALEVVEAVVAAIGADRTGIRLSPFNRFQGMRMADPIPQFSDLISRLPRGLANIHLVTGRVNGSATIESPPTETADFALKLWDGPLLAAGGYTAESAAEYVAKHPTKDIVIVFGRHFISTPDLPYRLREGIPFNPYDRSTFYIPESPVGYTDQPFSKEFEASQSS